MSDPANQSARGKAGDDSENPEPGASPIGSTCLPQKYIHRLTFERWVELDMIHRRLAMQERFISELQHCDRRPLHHSAT
ncbi:hypothetical protein [Agrobacterium tumefaciens]|uniref:hypothetical protein n=1 Tax=Agrobacterium tumefaciens TaxID=358 RepID=UPI001F1AF20F|nr:hypothetical protein [Agrobacterium tumefaciens]WCJ66210.1 hypothetical protein G6M15_25550 [Agrobacterium tumefaciens]